MSIVVTKAGEPAKSVSEPSPAPLATATPATEPAKPDTAKPVEATDQRLEAYLKKERHLSQMRKEIKQREDAIAAKENQYKQQYIDKQRLTTDPLGTLIDNGITYDQLTQMLLNQPNSVDPTIRAIRSQIEQIQANQAQASKNAEAATQAQYDQALNQIRTDVKSLVGTGPEYEGIKTLGMHEAVVDLIVQTFNDEGYVMDLADAASRVENRLVEDNTKLAQLPKVKAKWQPQTETPAATGPNTQRQPMKTLTNAVNSQTPKRSTDKERVQRAILAFQGKLNQG